MKDLQEQLKYANARIQELESELQSDNMSRTVNSVGPGPSLNTSTFERSRKHFRESLGDFDQVSEKLGALGVGDYGQTLFHTDATIGSEVYTS